MTNDQYRALPRYSNSDLTAYMDWRYNQFKPAPIQNAFAVGSTLHQLVLEPHIKTSLHGLDAERIGGMMKAAKANPTLAWALQWGVKERPILWECTESGLPLKAKLDILYKNQIVYDLKTTSASSQKSFPSHFQDFGYDRQAAFYLDAAQAKRFVFVAVQKKTDEVWVIEAPAEIISEGRKKYKKILTEIKKTGWMPEKWKNQ